jgi:hypothetical protein
LDLTKDSDSDIPSSPPSDLPPVILVPVPEPSPPTNSTETVAPPPSDLPPASPEPAPEDTAALDTVAAKQQEQREAKERQMRAIKQQRERQLSGLLAKATYNVEDLCSAAWNGGDIEKFIEMLNFLSVDEINKTNVRGQTALVCFFLLPGFFLIFSVGE